ncbi:MAG TPA: formylmethanofuran dehydrogenase subunit C [Burkholderiaceae bacterium]|nr:formylmethanofuran dehydrogenase subunit C [Burkholderiaceae bacterium]
MNAPGHLELRQRAAATLRLDLSGLIPEALAGKARSDIERIALAVGRRQVALAELFDVRGEPGDTLVIHTLDDRCDRIGAGMSRGLLRVEGPAGAYVGLGATGGRVSVSADCGPYCGAASSGALIEVEGHCGDFIGGALPGEHAGMNGGTVWVRGSAGDRAGDHMRRGLILVEGDCGDFAASRMGGGTVAVLGRVGAHAGYAMRRGTILALGPRPQPAPTFQDCGTHRLGFLVLLQRAWARTVPASKFGRLTRADARAARWVGDAGFGGQGELLHWGES